MSDSSTKPKAKWSHPSHRGIRSQAFSNIRGAILTDAKIDSYIAKGFYGPARQKALLAARKKKPKRPLSPFKKALKLLE